MSLADPAIVAPCPAPPADALPSARVLIEHQLAVLSRLTDIGMEVAEVCGREARAMTAEAASDDGAAPSPEQRHDLGLAFARVARAVRMTIALQTRLMKDLADLDRADENAARGRKLERRVRLSRLLDQAAEAAVDAQRQAGGRSGSDEDAIEAEIERLSSEAYARLTEVEDGEDFMGRPFDEVVAGICKDLGLSPEWTARVRAAVEPPAGAASSPPPPLAGVWSAESRPWDAKRTEGAFTGCCDPRPHHHAARGPPPPPCGGG